MLSRRSTLSLLLGALAPGCADRYGLQVCAVDEAGDPVEGAAFSAADRAWRGGGDGCAKLRRLSHPVSLVVSADGYLSEPALVGRDDEEVEVRLLSSEGRVATHFGGDVMLGRRYTEPESGEPLLIEGDAASAEALVSEISPVFSLASLSTVNLETVVGTFGDDEAYDAKRWLLLTRPEHLAGVSALGTDIVGLANNHQRDWLDDGVRSTLEALDEQGLPHVGAGLDEDAAWEPVTGEVGALEVAMLAWTSVDGDYVNDSYPTDEDEPPADLAAEDAWMWAPRTWGEAELGVPEAERRIGSAWAALTEAEASLSHSERAQLWRSAEEVYPELQDWVARRGHGGAALWDDVASPAAIADWEGRADVVVVQLHMGFQFSPAAGEAARSAARAAIDAGADLVVCHHPHVLQGLEWYKDRLIAYSLGNFIFDQNFLSTWPSGFLRAIWDEQGELVEARWVPGYLDAYQPVGAADGLGRGVLETLWERSALPGEARRGADGAVRTVAESMADEVEIPGFLLEHGTARITRGELEPEQDRVEVPASGVVELGEAGLLSADGAPAGVELGLDLLGLGRFEDEDTDEADDVLGWTWSSPDVSLSDRDPAEGLYSLQLIRQPGDADRVSARTLARVPLAEHRLWDDADGGTPLDGDARYSLRLRGWLDGESGLASARLVLYHFDDLDPTVAPESTILREVELALDLDERGWQELVVDVPDADLAPVDGRAPNAALLYLSLDPPSRHTTVLRLDQVQLIEWRQARALPEGFAQGWDLARATDGEAREVEISRWRW